MAMDSKEVEGCETQAVDLDSPDHSSESDDSMENLKKSPELLPDLPMEKDASISDQPKGTRRSERPRKPPSRFNEDTEPPKSTKKKVSKEEHLEGTSSKPLLIF